MKMFKCDFCGKEFRFTERYEQGRQFVLNDSLRVPREASETGTELVFVKVVVLANNQDLDLCDDCGLSALKAVIAELDDREG